MLYILTSIWVLRTPSTGQNLLFPCLCKILLEKAMNEWKFNRHRQEQSTKATLQQWQAWI